MCHKRFNVPKIHGITELFRLEKTSRTTEPKPWPIPTLSPDHSFGSECLKLWHLQVADPSQSQEQRPLVLVLGKGWREAGIQGLEHPQPGVMPWGAWALCQSTSSPNPWLQ